MDEVRSSARGDEKGHVIKDGWLTINAFRQGQIIDETRRECGWWD